MSISVIVSNFNGAKYLPKLLNSIIAQDGVETEIIVVDRDSTDESQEILAQYKQVIVTNEPPESGLVSGYQVGARLAKYEHLFFCNEDMWFEPDCLRCLEQAINIERRICASDPWQWTYDGEDWIHGGVRFESKTWDINSPYPFRTAKNTVDLPSGTEIPYPCAGALLIHREVFDEIGGWDTSFFLDDEDTDLFLRAWQRNWISVTVPEAKVYHAVGASHANKIDQNTKPVPVRKRRYISTCTNKSIIAVKYFSFPSALLSFATWGVRFANNCVKLRFEWAKADFAAVKEFLERLPAAIKFRKKNSTWNSKRPGEKFFRATPFQEVRG